MRIVLDLQGAQTESRFRGIGRYARSFSEALARNAGDNELWIAVNAAFPDSIESIRKSFRNLIPDERIRVFDIPSPVAEYDHANNWRARATEIIREHFLDQLHPDAIVMTSLFEGYLDNAVTSVGVCNTGAKTCVILYDLIPLLYPDNYLASPLQRNHYDRKIKSLMRADLLLAISEHSKHEAITTLSLPPERVETISAACDPFFSEPDDNTVDFPSLRKRLGLSRDFILYAPGGFDARKNIDGLITAYGLLTEATRCRYQLVIVSKLAEEVRKNLIRIAIAAGLEGDDLVLAGYVPEIDLRTLYRHTKLFVFPSKHEGFGLPALEAMSCGAAVIGANNTSIPEVIDNEAALFDASTPQCICDKMEILLNDDNMLDSLRRHSRRQASAFSWDRTALEALRAIERLVNRKDEPDAACLPIKLCETDIVSSIAGIHSSTNPDLRDLASVAECIAFNNGSMHDSRVFIDISGAFGEIKASGITAEDEPVIMELLESLTRYRDVAMICFEGSRHRRVNRHFDSVSDDRLRCITGDVVQFYQNDLCIAIFPDRLHAMELDRYRHLKSRGLRCAFVLANQPDTNMTDMHRAVTRHFADVAELLPCTHAKPAVVISNWIERHRPGLGNHTNQSSS